MLSVKLLEEADVLKIHDDILYRFGGLPGRGQDRSLASALYRIDNFIIYEGMRDLHQIAACYAIAIAQGHTFNDGNKRTAMTCMVNFLLLNGITLNVPNEDIEEMMVIIAEKKITYKKLTAWLKKFSVS